MSAEKKVVVVIPVYSDFTLTEQCLESLRGSLKGQEQPDVIVVDDGTSDADLLERLEVVCERYDAKLIKKETNSGFSATVNAGIKAADELSGLVLCNNDVQFINDSWLKNLQQVAASGVGIVGSKLLYPNGLIQHAGVYISLIEKLPYHRFHYAPGNLEASNKFIQCPVTAALQYITRDTINKVGLYDEHYSMAFEDMDYCFRAISSGVTIVYAPSVLAIHHECMTRYKKDDETSKKSENARKTGLELFLNTWSNTQVYNRAGMKV